MGNSQRGHYTARMLYIIYTTLPDASSARALAHALVEHKLVACANIMPPHQSVYRWESAVCEAQEVALWCKTSADAVEGAMAYLRTHHPYDTPCLLAWHTSHSDSAYTAWAQQSTTPAP